MNLTEKLMFYTNLEGGLEMMADRRGMAASIMVLPASATGEVL